MRSTDIWIQMHLILSEYHRWDPDCVYLKLESVFENRIHAFCFSDTKFLFTSEEDNTIDGNSWGMNGFILKF